MKVLVNIIYFNTNKENFLEKLINEYDSYQSTVDIFIHSNKKYINNLKDIKYTNGNIVVKKYNLFFRYLLYRNKGYYLTWAPRKFIKKNIKKYDIFIQTDDDILIPKESFEYWLNEKDKLFSKNYVPGFMLLEKDNEGNEFALGYEKQKIEKIIKIGDDSYYVNDNHRYMACWIYDRKMMNYWVESGFYDIKQITKKEDLKSQILDILKINNLKIRYLFYNRRNIHGHGIRENSAYGMNSKDTGLIKDVLFKIENNKFSNSNKIYHLDAHYSEEDHPIGQTNILDIT